MRGSEKGGQEEVEGVREDEDGTRGAPQSLVLNVMMSGRITLSSPTSKAAKSRFRNLKKAMPVLPVNHLVWLIRTTQRCSEYVKSAGSVHEWSKVKAGILISEHRMFPPCALSPGPGSQRGDE